MPLTLNYKDFFHEDAEPSQEYWGERAAGCIFIAKDTGRILLAHRSGKVDFEPDTWGTWGGKIDLDETPKDAVVREVEEETGYTDVSKIQPLHVYRDGQFEYHNFLIIVPFEFTPQLNWENQGSKWVTYGDWPEPLHFGMVELIKHAGTKIKKIIDLLSKKKYTFAETMDAPPAIQITSPTTNNSVVDSRKLADAYVVAATLWGEARGEGERGMHAVMNVIMNRAKGNFSNARSIALSPSQFSIWNSVSNPEQKSLELATLQRQGKLPDKKQYQEALKIVDAAMKGELTDITDGAQFYFNPHKANPKWAKKMKKVATIGNHDFYKVVPKKTSKHDDALSARVAASIQGGLKPIREELQSLGLIDDGIYGYKLTSEHSYVNYGYDPSTRIFYLYMVRTPNEQDLNKGYAKELMEKFMQIIHKQGGSLDEGSYTTSGMSFVKHVLERLAKQYHVPLVNGNHRL